MASINLDDLEPNPSNASLLDPDEFRRQGHMIIDFLADYYRNIGNFPVLSQVEPGYLRKQLPEFAPYLPEPIDAILKDVEEHIIPGITHWQSPNYFAYFPSSASIAGFLGEVLSTGFNIVGFNWMSSPAATELENVVIDWFGEMLKLPKSFLFSGNGGGVLQGTTCEAILCCVTAARDQMLHLVGDEMFDKLVIYGSDQTHSALQKAAQIAGIRLRNIRAVKTTKSTWYGLSPDSFRAMMEADRKAGLIPFFLCATVGTTSTNAVDPIGPLCDVAKDYNMWIHVDAAYAGSACICPEFRPFINGVEKADSFSLNAHKWFFTTLDCCCLWVKNPPALVKSLSTNPEYLKNNRSDSKQVMDYKDWQITLSRRFRALKLWMVIRSYGIANLRKFLRGHVNMAKLFENLVRHHGWMEVVVPRNFSMVCFRISPSTMMKKRNAMIKPTLRQEERANELTRKLLDSVNASGHLFVTHAMVDGVYMIRFAVGTTLTEEEHVLAAWKVIEEHLYQILEGENVN